MHVHDQVIAWPVPRAVNDELLGSTHPFCLSVGCERNVFQVSVFEEQLDFARHLGISLECFAEFQLCSAALTTLQAIS